MKRIASVGLALFMLTGTTSFADTNVNIQIDGKPMKNGAGAIIMENRTMVPFRAVFEELGADMIQWDKDENDYRGKRRHHDYFVHRKQCMFRQRRTTDSGSSAGYPEFQHLGAAFLYF